MLPVLQKPLIGCAHLAPVLGGGGAVPVAHEVVAGPHGKQQHEDREHLFPPESFPLQHQGEDGREAQQQAEIDPVHQIAPAPDEIEIGR